MYVFSCLDSIITIMRIEQKGRVVIPGGVCPWPHELRIANILALAGYAVEFLPKANTKTADIMLDGMAFEIKSPRSANSNTLEHMLKRALKQSCNIIVDTSRMRNVRDDSTRRFLVNQVKMRRQIKKLLMISKRGQIIDISGLAR